jgi:hypothetical protein
MSKIKAYLSHPIRGVAGNNATDEVMTANNTKAKTMGNTLRLACPELSLYIPAEMDEFLIPKGIRPVDIVEGLLALDCAIISASNLLLVYIHDGYVSGGMRREINHAEKHAMPILYFNDATNIEEFVIDIKHYLN